MFLDIFIIIFFFSVIIYVPVISRWWCALKLTTTKEKERKMSLDSVYPLVASQKIMIVFLNYLPYYHRSISRWTEVDRKPKKGGRGLS